MLEVQAHEFNDCLMIYLVEVTTASADRGYTEEEVEVPGEEKCASQTRL